MKWQSRTHVDARNRARISAWLAAGAVTMLAALPVALLAVWSLARAWYWPALWPRQWSVRAWAYVFASTTGTRGALLASLSLALLVTLLSLLLALPAARALAWREFRGQRLLFFLLLLPVLAPPLAAAMGVHALFLRYGLSDTLIGVALAHLIPAVPYTTLMLMGSFARFDRDFEAQARTLGARPRDVWRYVTLPALAPGVAVAASFAFLISWSQYLLTLLVGGGRVQTLALMLVGFSRSGDEAITAAVSLVFLAPTLLVFVFTAKYLKEM